MSTNSTEFKPLSKYEQLQQDLYLASRCRALWWAEKKFGWNPKAFYQTLLLGCLDKVYRYPLDYPVAEYRGETIQKFAWRIGRQCCPEGSIIHTRDGQLMPIEEHPDAFKTKQNAEIYNIEIDGGYSVRCTGNHPIATRGKEREFINAENLQVGDEVEVLVEFDKWGDGKISYSNERSLSVGKKRELVLPNGRMDTSSPFENRESTEQISSFLEMNEELAELLGYIMTSGNAHASITENKGLIFTNSNMNYLKRVEELVNNQFPDIRVNWQKKLEMAKNGESGTENDTYVIHFSLKGNVSAAHDRGKNQFEEFLQMMDFHRCGFPRAVAKYFTKAQVCAFLRGAWAGNGSFYIGNRSDGYKVEGYFACGLNRIYAEFFQGLLAKIGVMTKLESQLTNLSITPSYKLCFRNIQTVETFRDAVGQVLDKPLPIGKKAIENRFDNDFKKYPDGEKTTFKKINKITIELKRKNCYDVEIKDKGWFVTGNVRVHNSGKTEILGIGALYLAICKPIIEYKKAKPGANGAVKVYPGRDKAVKRNPASGEYPIGAEKVVPKDDYLKPYWVQPYWGYPYKRGAKIIVASADADKANTIFDRVKKFLNDSKEFQLAMEEGVISIKKHPFPTVEIDVEGWKHPAEIMFRGPGAKGQALRSKTFDYKLYDEADYFPSSFFEAEKATEINAGDNAVTILSSTPSGRRDHFFKACFVPGAGVMTPTGVISIEDIEVGDSVYNRFGNIEPVTDVMNRPYEGEIIEVNTSLNGEVFQVTPNHRFMAIRKKDRFCEGCRKIVWKNLSGCILHGRHKGFIKVLKPEYFAIDTLKEGDLLAIPQLMWGKFFSHISIKKYFLHKDEEFVYVPITLLTRVKYKGSVFNLTVGNDHSYNVSGFGVANCTDAERGYKEFWFPSWENPNYTTKTDRDFRAVLNQTAYEHEIMADWGTVEMGVFDWTYFQNVFNYSYANNAKENRYEYRLIKLNSNDVKHITIGSLGSWLAKRFVVKNPLAKYYFGADLGYSADPSEFVVFEEFNGVMKMVLRIHMEHLTYDIQADIIALLDTYFKFEMLGMDAGNNGQSVAQILQSKRQGWQKFAHHRFDKRLIPIPFGGRLLIDKRNGKDITEPAKIAMTNMIIHAAEQKLLIMPGLAFDDTIENQFRNHTYSMGSSGQIVYSKGSIYPDHCIDSVRTAFYARCFSKFVNHRGLPSGSVGRARNW